VGRKIGFTNPQMWELYGVCEPIWAYVYDCSLVQERGDSSTYSLAGLTEPKIEPEIVFHFHRAPKAGTDLPTLLGCIDWVAQGFEIVQSHFSGWKFGAADAVADSGLHRALMVGHHVPRSRLGGNPIAVLENFSVKLLCDGKLREIGYGSNVLGHPVQALRYLIALLARQPQYTPVGAGEIVTTGTITTAQSIHAGEKWQTEMHGAELPNLKLALTA
jgi:2-oxo-3-hexenedioate decarboxylase